MISYLKRKLRAFQPELDFRRPALGMAVYVGQAFL